MDLTANSRCRPVAQVTTAGQRHDSLGSRRSCRKRTSSDPGSWKATKETRKGHGRQGVFDPERSRVLARQEVKTTILLLSPNSMTGKPGVGLCTD